MTRTASAGALASPSKRTKRAGGGSPTKTRAGPESGMSGASALVEPSTAPAPVGSAPGPNVTVPPPAPPTGPATGAPPAASPSGAGLTPSSPAAPSSRRDSSCSGKTLVDNPSHLNRDRLTPPPSSPVTPSARLPTRELESTMLEIKLPSGTTVRFDSSTPRTPRTPTSQHTLPKHPSSLLDSTVDQISSYVDSLITREATSSAELVALREKMEQTEDHAKRMETLLASHDSTIQCLTQTLGRTMESHSHELAALREALEESRASQELSQARWFEAIRVRDEALGKGADAVEKRG
ncbi:hypothetical protein IAT38_001005 [Cryptococcus sp. DSM 104549]